MSLQISLEMSFELIVKSDLYLLGSLKKLCSNIIRAHITEVNVLDVINLARILGLPKLESAAIEHIAHNLDEVRKHIVYNIVRLEMTTTIIVVSISPRTNSARWSSPMHRTSRRDRRRTPSTSSMTSTSSSAISTTKIKATS